MPSSDLFFPLINVLFCPVRWLHVPLEALLLDASNNDARGRRALCVERGSPIVNPLSSAKAAAAAAAADG